MGEKMNTQAKQIPFGKILIWAVLILILFVTLFPFWWVLRTALTTPSQVFTNTSSLLPVDFTWANFGRVLGMVDSATAVAAGGSGQAINFFLFLRNSVIFATIIAVSQVFFSALAAYALARLNFRGRNQLFMLYISALMIPPIVTLIPNFTLISLMIARV